MKKVNWILFLLIIILLQNCQPETQNKIEYIPFHQVKVNDNFWSRILQLNYNVTIPHNIEKCREVGIITNFAYLANRTNKNYIKGLANWDAILYKTIGAASYALMQNYDEKLDKQLDTIITYISEVQEEDGYINTGKIYELRTSGEDIVKKRWEDLKGGIELYNCGHLYEAAVAHYKATNKRDLLNVAIKNADLVYSIFGPDKDTRVPGHERIEFGLVKLYSVTKDEKYLELAQFFIDARGQEDGHELYGEFSQDHKPFIEQTEAVGQTPRACYLYSGAASVAYYKDMPEYKKALDVLWEDMVTKKMYINGGIGSNPSNEGFDEPYKLPNLTAYCEICAAIALMTVNERMFLLEPNAKYFDIFERTAYNNFIAGFSLEGNSFFYACPLESDGKYLFNLGWFPKKGFDYLPYKEKAATRKTWFPCACCPPNLARYIPQIPGFIYARRKNTLYVNLFIGSSTSVQLNNIATKINQITNYPWDGKINIEILPEKQNNFTLKLRVPCWANNNPVPGDLYHFVAKSKHKPSIKLNGKKLEPEINNGYITISRNWQEGDNIEYQLPFEPKRMVSHNKVEENQGKVALQLGPVLYCIESADNNDITSVRLSDKESVQYNFEPDLLDGVNILTWQIESDNTSERRTILAIPYYVFSNRGVGEMKVWIPRGK